MKFVDNRTTEKNKNKSQTTNIIYEKKSNKSIVKNNNQIYNKQIITKSNSHQLKTKTVKRDFIREEIGHVSNATD